MKLVGTLTLATPPEGQKVITNTVDLGSGVSPQLLQTALHQQLGQMVNMLPMVEGASFVALSVTAESA